MIKYGIEMTNDEKLRLEQVEELKPKRKKFMEKMAQHQKKLKDDEDEHNAKNK